MPTSQQKQRARQYDKSRHALNGDHEREQMKETLREAQAHIEQQIGMPLPEVGKTLKGLVDLKPGLEEMVKAFKDRAKFFASLKMDVLRMMVLGIVLGSFGFMAVGALLSLKKSLGL